MLLELISEITCSRAQFGRNYENFVSPDPQDPDIPSGRRKRNRSFDESDDSYPGVEGSDPDEWTTPWPQENDAEVDLEDLLAEVEQDLEESPG